MAYNGALLLALAPAGGALLGGLLALFVRLSKLNLAFALHVGAGAVLAVVGVELLPRSLQTTSPILILASFVAGAGFFVGLGWIGNKIGQHLGKAGTGSTYAVLFGVGIDLLTDGIMIYTGQQISNDLGLLLGIGLFIADFPEAFSTIASVRTKMSFRFTLTTAAAFPVLVLLGVPLGSLLLAGQSPVLENVMLAFTAGILVLVVIEGLIPEAHQLTRRQSGTAAFLFTLGFTALTALSLFIG